MFPPQDRLERADSEFPESKPWLIVFQNFVQELFGYLIGAHDAIYVGMLSNNLWGLPGSVIFILRSHHTLFAHQLTPFGYVTMQHLMETGCNTTNLWISHQLMVLFVNNFTILLILLFENNWTISTSPSQPAFSIRCHFILILHILAAESNGMK